jgi:hypothetical protein
MATGQPPVNLEPKHRFAATVKLSVPPNPNEVKAKWQEPHIPVDGLCEEEFDTFFVFCIDKELDALVATGDGQVGSPIGCGQTIHAAFHEVEAAIARLAIPDLQYRNDIEKCVTARYNTLEQQGWLRPLG